MDEEEIYWLVLSAKYGFSWAKWKKIKEQYSLLSLAFLDGFKKCPSLDIQLITSEEYDIAKFRILEYLELLNIQWMAFINQDYPVCFKELSSPPVIIYYKGNFSLTKSNFNLAVIGSRRVTNYSKLVMQKILPPALASSVNVVSGLAFGVDYLGHKFSLETPQSKTIAVLGGGLDSNSIYPNEHLKMAEKILEQDGLILSEYFPGRPALPFQFPQRNRLIVSLSKTVWVVQAGMKSGTLLTAKIARDMGKDLLVTPASILEDSYLGNHQILQDGAWPLISPIEIFSSMGINSVAKPISKNNIQTLIEAHNLTNNQSLLLKSLENNSLNLDQIIEITKFNLETLNADLGYLEILGLVENLGFNQFSLAIS
jgi:DNA processing protein